MRYVYIFSISLLLIGCSTSDDSVEQQEVETPAEYGVLRARVTALNTIGDGTMLELIPSRSIQIDGSTYSILGYTESSYHRAGLYIHFPSTIDSPGTYTEFIAASLYEGQSCSPNLTGGLTCWWAYLYNSIEETITITKFTEERIAGTFEMTFYSSPNEGVSITDGYFDIQRE
ncbi:MAG: hypothetical protein KJO00_12180 [Bacteroidia bacterium]|nr:hypothetical protein [Bacteroidia bacterium]